MVKSAERRRVKFEHKIDPDVLKTQTTALKPLMVKGQAEYFPAITDLETRIKLLVEAEGVSTLLVRDYLNYGRELFRVSRRFVSVTANAQAQIILDKWSSRGLDGSTLVRVANLVGLNPSAPPTPPVEEGYKPLGYYRKLDQYHGGVQVSAHTLNRNTLYKSLHVAPFHVVKTIHVDRIACMVWGAVAASKIRLGIYKDNGNIYPSDLILDAGEVSGASTGWKEIVIDETLEAGVFWLAQHYFSNPIMYAWYLYTTPFILGHGIGDYLCSRGYLTIRASYGALPDPFPPDVDCDTNSIYCTWLRIVS